MRAFIYLLLIVFVSSTMFAERIPDAHISVLCYHHVDLNSKTPYSVTSEQLIAQVSALNQAGFKFVTLKQIDDFMYFGKDIPSKSVAITFDDGNLTVLTKALPILKKMGVPFALFVYPSSISVGHKKQFMDWDDVRLLQKEGVTIGSHSFYHPYLTRPSGIKTAQKYNEWLETECVKSKQTIESQIGVSVNYFAIPFGLYDKNVYAKVKKSGYRLSFNINGMNNSIHADPYFYNRVMVVNTDTPKTVVSKASVKPVYFDYTYPLKLARITSQNILVKYKIFNAGDYDLTTAKLHLGNPVGKGYYSEKEAMNYQKVYLGTEAFYQSSVTLKDKAGHSCMGNWSFTYQKNIPDYLQ